MEYVVAIYALTERFPRDERFGLTAQLRRAAVAIPSNISEGHQQGTRAYLRYVVIATGSVAECETQLEIARRYLIPRQRQQSGLKDTDLTFPDETVRRVMKKTWSSRT